MANTKATTNKTATKKTQTKTVASKEIIQEVQPAVVAEPTPTPKKTKDLIPDSALINVRSNSFGKLIFQSKRTGERIVWDECGEVHQLTMAMLRAIKTEAITFFRDQLVILLGFADENIELFDAGEIYKQLFVAQYYDNLIDPSDEYAICHMSEKEIMEKIPLLPEGARENLIVALNTYYEKGILDSIKTIKAYEKALGCEIRESD